VLELHAATVLLQWSAGGLFFGWVTTRRREVGIGYGWSLRVTYGLMAVLALGLGLRFGVQPVREIGSAGVIVGCVLSLGQSWQRRAAGVVHQRELVEARSARVAEMTGIDRDARTKEASGPEFDPRLDLIAPVFGFLGLIAAGFNAGDPVWLQTARLVVGALFLGAVSDAMLLGHWYLVQPGMSRAPLLELVKWTGVLWLPEVLLMLTPTGMISSLNGTIEDGYNGMLGWFWIACVVATIALVFVTRLALKEPQYSAVMAATGLLYLAILTAFGVDLVARAILTLA
jgi:hypothetical protein